METLIDHYLDIGNIGRHTWDVSHLHDHLFNSHKFALKGRLNPTQLTIRYWKASEFQNLSNKIYLFKANAPCFQGRIFISMKTMDLFSIYFTDEDNRCIDQRHSVRLNDLVAVIDNRLTIPKA
jgi:hypothetical protein